MPTKIERTSTTAISAVKTHEKPKTTTTVKVVSTPVTTKTSVELPTFVPPKASKSWNAIAPKGTQTSVSATPSTLWGAESTKSAVTAKVESFKKLSVTQQAEELKHIKAEQTHVQTQIADRVQVLDQKWEKLSVNKKCVALRNYQVQSKKCDYMTRKKLGSALDDADNAGKKIEKIRVQINKLGPSSKATTAQKKMRTQLNEEVRVLRRKQSDAVIKATKIIDEKGLKLDRLTVTEKDIDPVGAAGPNSLGSLVAKWLDLSEIFDLCTSVYDKVKGLLKEEARKADEQHQQNVKEEREHDLEIRRYTLKQINAKLEKLRFDIDVMNKADERKFRLAEAAAKN